MSSLPCSGSPVGPTYYHFLPPFCHVLYVVLSQPNNQHFSYTYLSFVLTSLLFPFLEFPHPALFVYTCSFSLLVTWPYVHFGSYPFLSLRTSTSVSSSHALLFRFHLVLPLSPRSLSHTSLLVWPSFCSPFSSV